MTNKNTHKQAKQSKQSKLLFYLFIFTFIIFTLLISYKFVVFTTDFNSTQTLVMDYLSSTLHVTSSSSSSSFTNSSDILELNQSLASHMQNLAQSKSTDQQVNPITENELSHLMDVKKVFALANFLLLITTFFLIFLIYKQLPSKDLIRKNFFYASLANIFLLIAFSLFIYFNFDLAFELFHKLFFPNGNYTFPLFSFLISTFPPDFFANTAFKIVLTSLILSTILFIITKRLPFLANNKRK